MIREHHLPPPSAIELEPAGSRPHGSAAATAGTSQVTVALVAILAAVLAGSAVAGRVIVRPAAPRHLTFDELAGRRRQQGRSRRVGGGGGARGTGSGHPVTSRTVGRGARSGPWPAARAIPPRGRVPRSSTGAATAGPATGGGGLDPKTDRWRRLSRSPLTNRGPEPPPLDGPGDHGLRRGERQWDPGRWRRLRPVTDRWRTIAAGPSTDGAAGHRLDQHGAARGGRPGPRALPRDQGRRGLRPRLRHLARPPRPADANQRRRLRVDRFGAHRLWHLPRPPAQRAHPRRPGPRFGPRPGHRPLAGPPGRSPVRPGDRPGLERGRRRSAGTTT